MTQKDDFQLQDFLPYLLNQAAEESSLAFQQIYKDRYGMLRTEWRVLFHLGIYGEMSAKDIGTRTKVHKTKISRAVAKLEERRFLTRRRDESDRRLEYLSLTKAGLATYAELRSVAVDYDSQLTSKFSHEELTVLRRMLRMLAHID